VIWRSSRPARAADNEHWQARSPRRLCVFVVRLLIALVIRRWLLHHTETSLCQFNVQRTAAADGDDDDSNGVLITLLDGFVRTVLVTSMLSPTCFCSSLTFCTCCLRQTYRPATEP